MAGDWSKLSDLWEYWHTEGDHSVLSCGKNINLSRDKLRKPEPSKRVYEEVSLDDVSKEKDHIVVYNHGVKKIADFTVPELSKKTAQWDHTVCTMFFFEDVNCGRLDVPCRISSDKPFEFIYGG
jgi:hypothetical protein